MRNIKCTIAYDGSRYNGWQKQENTDNTIQGKLEHMFYKLLWEKIEIHGAGRTDAGVHARGQVFHFHTRSTKPLEELFAEANSHLPQDMAIVFMEEVPERFHSRLHATSKWYRYIIDNGAVSDVFYRKYAYYVPQLLDVNGMVLAAQQLAGTWDYKSFCSNKRTKKSTVRTVYDIQITQELTYAGAATGKIYMDFHGNGFLYNMVRIMAGTLIEVGLGIRRAEEMTEILMQKDREAAGATAPAQGLFLMEVGYAPATIT